MDPECNDPRVCWSIWVKCGKRTEDIWRYHKFTTNLLEKVYYNIGSEGVLNDGKVDNPIEKLAKLLHTISKSIAEIVLKQANKEQFDKNNKIAKQEWE